MRNSHEYVEIGGVKWATKNVGAEKETDFGLYFQHGEIQGYPHPTNLCKFDKTPKAFCDSVKANWGDNWRMPTKEEFNALLRNTTNEWVTDYQGSSVNGRLFTDKTDNSKKLFFPAYGCCSNEGVYGVGKLGFYWSSSLDDYSVNYAWHLYFSNDVMDVGIYYGCRYYGHGIRGVLADK